MFILLCFEEIFQKFKFFLFQNDDGEDKGEAFDLSKLDKEESDEAPVKVHEIKFDEYGIMDDGLEATTNEQLKNLKGKIIIQYSEKATKFERNLPILFENKRDREIFFQTFVTFSDYVVLMGSTNKDYSRCF